MSLKSGTVYWVECDGCGEQPEDGEGYQAVYETADRAADNAGGFVEVDGKWLCDGCQDPDPAQGHGTSEGHGSVAS